MTLTPRLSPCSISSMICFALYLGSATLILGVAAAVLKNPSFILSSKSRPAGLSAPGTAVPLLEDNAVCLFCDVSEYGHKFSDSSIA